MGTEITLKWEAISPLKDFQALLVPPICGVYIWGFKINDEFIPYYVGSSDVIFKRICEHSASIMSGKYTIYHKGSLANFSQHKDDIADFRGKGKVYEPNWPESFMSFVENRKAIQKHIDFMIDTFSFTYAVVEGKEYLKKIEGKCIEEIRKDNLSNQRQPNSGDIILRHEGNSTIVDFIHSHNNKQQTQ